MSSHQILNPADHGELRVNRQAGAHLGDGAMASLAVPAEFRRLACEYPLLFRYDQETRSFGALALFGFEPGENLFLDGDTWDASVKPLAMAVQPFLVGRGRDGGDMAQVHIDMAHPRIAQDGEGMRVFDAAGQPTPYLEQAAEMLAALDAGYRAADAFHAAADRYGLLEPFSMDVTLDDGSAHRLVGYHMVNEEKLRALEPGALAELHRDGHLEPLFMAVASLGNLGKLVRRKNRRRGG
jgi:hypothetical protein